MLCQHTVPMRSPHVMVEFGDGAHSFLLPRGATLAELADRIEELTVMHAGALIAVHVGFNLSNASLLPTMASQETTLRLKPMQRSKSDGQGPH